MAKAGVLEWDGEVIEVLPVGQLRVKLQDSDLVVLCYISGKMKQAHISVIVGDKVRVEVNPYDTSKGRISYRYNPTHPHSFEKIDALAA